MPALRGRHEHHPQPTGVSGELSVWECASATRGLPRRGCASSVVYRVNDEMDEVLCDLGHVEREASVECG